jgi:hypothetical protein
MLKRFFLGVAVAAISLLLSSAPLMAINSPQDIAGLAVWLDGMSIAGADGVDLTTWTDSSPNGYDATNGPSAFVQTPPEITSDTIGTTVGAKAASFNTGSFGGTEALEISTWHPAQGDYTIFVLARIPDTPGLPDFQGYLVGQDFTGSNAGESVFGIGDAMGDPSLPDSGGELAFTNDGASEGGASKIVATGNSADADNLWHIYSVIVQDNPAGGVGSDVTLNIDGTDVATGQIDSNGIWGSDGIQPVTIAGNFGGSNENSLGVDIAQVVIYSGALSANDFEAVGFYLEQTYGLTTAFETPPGFVLSSLTTQSVVEGAATDSYTLVLDRSPTSPVTVDLSADADQVTVTPLQVVFDQNDFDTPQTILVTAVDDDATESHPHATSISHTVSQPGGSQEFDGGAVPNVSVSIGENDCGFGPFSPMDFNEDCSVNLVDYAIFSAEWLECSVDDSGGECPRPAVIKFGVVTDAHHTTVTHPLADIGDRSLDLQNFASFMNVEDADFVISTGDQVHEGHNGGIPSRYTNNIFTDNVTTYKTNIGTFDRDIYYVLGNHDVSGTLTVSQLSAIWHDPPAGHHMPLPGYYSFDYPNHRVRFIVLDAQYHTDDTPRQPLGPGFAVGYIPQVERTWLDSQLADARALNYRVIVFMHQILGPDPVFGLINSADVVAILASYSDVVLLVMSGHIHASGLDTLSGIPNISIAAMTNNNDNWALVELFADDSIKITGHGLVPDWTLP